jgi:hypothetical protein
MDQQLKNLDVLDGDTIRNIRLNNYFLDENKFENNNKSRVEFGILGGSVVSHTKSNIVDIENDLLGITRTNSKCPARRFLPNDRNEKGESVIIPIDNYKTDDKKVLNTDKVHLKPINFFNYQLIPSEPLMKFDDCNV